MCGAINSLFINYAFKNILTLTCKYIYNDPCSCKLQYWPSLALLQTNRSNIQWLNYLVLYTQEYEHINHMTFSEPNSLDTPANKSFRDLSLIPLWFPRFSYLWCTKEMRFAWISSLYFTFAKKTRRETRILVWGSQPRTSQLPSVSHSRFGVGPMHNQGAALGEFSTVTPAQFKSDLQDYCGFPNEPALWKQTSFWSFQIVCEKKETKEFLHLRFLGGVIARVTAVVPALHIRNGSLCFPEGNSKFKITHRHNQNKHTTQFEKIRWKKIGIKR